MTKLLSFRKDQQGFNSYAPATADDKWSATLPATTESSFTVPSNFQNWVAFFSYQPGADMWVDLTGATAAAPAGATFASTTSELNPAQRWVQAGDTISVYNNSADAMDVGVSLYAVTAS